MSKNERPKTQKHHARKKEARRKPDQRIRRTHDRLGFALVQLIAEKPIDDITVQEVLDRASVGRSTFYLHFRDKDDLLLSQLETFLETMSAWLNHRNEESDRILPVEEMFAHIGSRDNKMYRALAVSGRLHDFFDLAQGYFARSIKQRIQQRIKRRLTKPKRLTESSRPPNLPQGVLDARALDPRVLDARASALAGTRALAAAMVARPRLDRIPPRHGRTLPSNGLAWRPLVSISQAALSRPLKADASLQVISKPGKKEKAANISVGSLYLMPATTYSPTHFRVQYNRPGGA